MILPNLISFGWFPPPPKAVDKKNNNNQENDESSRSSNNNNKGNAMLAQFTKNLTVLQDSVMFRDQLKSCRGERLSTVGVSIRGRVGGGEQTAESRELDDSF